MLGSLASLALLCSSSFVSAQQGSYGNEPWVDWAGGSPLARAASVVASARGTARFTVLTPRLLRLEYAPDGLFEDARTLTIWTRDLPTPPFSASTVGNVTTIDTGDFGVCLTYSDDGKPFSAASLRVERRTPAFWPNASAVWSPDLEPGADAGQLFGTFHTLDSGLTGFVGLNCSTLDPNAGSGDTADFFP